LVTSTSIGLQAQQLERPIERYDGIEFGTTLNQVKERLVSVQGISKDAAGKPLLEKVPTKTYYRYYVQRSSAKGELTSEVNVYFKNGKVVQFKDVFGGSRVSTRQSVTRTFNEKIEELTKLWGNPTAKSKLLATWVRDNRKAVLSLEIPESQYAYPVLKIVVAEK
jgi:hypothetical protein